jgi:hypothetical protein
VIGDHDETVGRAGASRIEEVLVRRVGLDQPLDRAEARRSGLGIGHGP